MLVNAYEFGKIVINETKYEKDLIIYPDRIEPDWWRENSHLVKINDIKGILNTIPVQKSSNAIVVLIGTGIYGEMKVSQDVIDAFESKGIQLICEPTNNTCEAYNKMVGDGRVVIAALHLTC